METITGTPKELSYQLTNLKQDKIYELREYKALRGTQANRYFHKLVNELARYNRNNGYAISDDDMKVMMNVSYGALATKDNGDLFEVVIPRGEDISYLYPYTRLSRIVGNNEYYLFYKRTHELNSKEFYQLIKGVEQECRDVGIKTLSDIEFEQMMKEYDKEFRKWKNY